MILCLETATNLCSVALCDSDGVVSLRENNELKSHASMLTIFIEQLLKESRINPQALDAVAVSKGPGSYTGLRIGVSVAKGIAYGASIPLLAIDTTFSMFHGLSGEVKKLGGIDLNTLLCPMLDARRMEVYYSIYDLSGNRIKDISAEIIDEMSFNDIPETQKIIFFGDGALKCKEVIKRQNTVFKEDFRISASYLQIPAYDAFTKRRFEDVAYFEPFYLRDFITTKQRKNILG
jgi:tRNA threonylcarbamoyladenosine biosynthesis protein TsaB